ncbi:hypothetical protein [Maribacter arcticus]|uniref:hypothetical protein n=1 Tax=Maribacter arcticus TaxID=561365 RepID=UPI003002D068
MNKTGEQISLTQRYWNIIKNGLLLFGIRNKLAQVGLDIRPYYWVQEEIFPCEEPIIKGDVFRYNVRFLNLEEIEELSKNLPKMLAQDLIVGIKNGQLCIALEYNNEIAAFTFVELKNFVFNRKAFTLKHNEAYLLNMWTFHSFRGRNLAPYLRYKTYQLLRKQGRNSKFSITEYFNKSSIKFKKKLNSKNLMLIMSIVLFKRYYWNFLIKTYK